MSPLPLAAASSRDDKLIGMFYETWFVPEVKTVAPSGQVLAPPGFLANDWSHAPAAVPVLGKYTSYNVEVLRKHAEWLAWAGVDFLGVDWTNNLFDTKNPWENHQGYQLELIKTTRLLLETLTKMRRGGLNVPKVTLMLGLENGPPGVPVSRLNYEIRWVYENFVKNPELNESLLYVDGKPLLILFKGDGCDFPPDLQASRFTVRWMSHQLQVRHDERCGKWSWMDGSIEPVVTYNSGRAEAVAVTTAFFPLIGPDSGGWLDDRARGRRNGATYIEEWKTPVKAPPRFVLINQWNEFYGGKNGEGWGPKQAYGDEYSIELSQSIEPTKLDGCGYRGCGGWGYYYLNLTKALISLYRGETPDATVLALAAPLEGSVVTTSKLPVTWSSVGRTARGYTLRLDGRVVAAGIHDHSYILDLSSLGSGRHVLTLTAEGTKSYFDLPYEKLATRFVQPRTAVATVRLIYSASKKP